MKQQIYQVIQEDIIKKIRNNTLRPGDKLPTESEFCEIYDTSKSSVKKALNRLVNNGYLYAIQRVGYYVNIPKYNNYILSFDPMELFYQGEKLDQIKLEQISETDTYDFRDDSDPKKAKILCLPELYSVGNVAVALSLTKFFYRKALFLKNKSTLTQIPDHNQIGELLKIFTHNRKITIYGKDSPMIIEKLLELPSQIPLFVVEESFYDRYEKLFGKRTIYYRKEYIVLSGVSDKNNIML
ncbi:GntR family transcriptional regulator [Acetobacterium paludosum]|uniref:GntR family transcriptional regulator n=1 Tax=Acetobacterium paludosum TaxID=52693 RepID=A0A923I5H2_9FIRM|nr:GntR family transcriptional regulator [Acetobacterium paludosum]MBC3889365.1 GntR family transcriptional regulator [Acetobacterium paludosum]